MPQLQVARLISYAAVSLLLVSILILYTRDSERAFLLVPAVFRTNEPSTILPSPLSVEEDTHPIVALIAQANSDFESFVQKQTFDLASAAHDYREKRGRHPPPGFKVWWEYARDNGVVMIEESWDQIYHDLTPLWALEPHAMLADVRAQRCVLQIRKGKAAPTCDQFWLPIWAEFVDSVAGGVPDLDLAMNQMDEPRLWIGREEMDRLVAKERKERFLGTYDEMSGNFSGACSVS